MTANPPLSVFMIASEALPYAKSGGLADVVGALPKILARMGCRVHLFHPYYRCVKESVPRLAPPIDGFTLATDSGSVAFEIMEHRPFPGVTTYFLRDDPSFDRAGLYGGDEGDYPDNARRFSQFCRAALVFMEKLRAKPDLIHVHDWQAALIPLYLRHRPDLAPSLSGVPSLLTIHNLTYQGIFPPEALVPAGIPPALFHMEGIEFYGQVNFLKGGILYADAINTVSRRYSREIQKPVYGAGLENVLKRRRRDLYGILNGVDYEIWDPAVDPHLVARYSLKDLSGKVLCKKDLLRTFGLGDDVGPPVMATISRLIDQKGFDIIAPLMPSLLELGYRYILLGTGEVRYQKAFTAMARRYPKRMAIKIAYDESLSHRIEAGADFFLMPSRFEPCGLNQIYSLRYGTIPIVRSTGGLDDTITGYDPSTGRGNGFKFDKYSSEALALKAREALKVYQSPHHRERILRNAMGEDFSWEASARQYLDLYRKLIDSRGTRR